jgi:hypothetical protein
MPALACLAGWSLAVADDRPELAHAAAELRHHFAMAGAPAGCSGEISLSAGASPTDGFTIEVGDSAVSIAGDSPRGALNGVYWLLEALGFAWVEPGPDGIALVPGRQLAPGRHRETPAFDRRTLILGQDALHDDWPAWLEWASRNRLNDIFFHDTPPSRLGRSSSRPTSPDALAADRGGWMFERWDADGSRIRDEAAVRALTLQFGGHHLPTVVPRDLFAAHPDWFPLRAGERDPRYNLCVSSPAAVDQLRRGAETFVARFPGADVYHLWADDIRGGGWCECAGCAGLSPSDQALAATNVLAEAVSRVVPGARVAHLAYHDTVAPPATVRPAENLLCLWAPRERCYAHAVDDASCSLNRDTYWKPFLGLVDVFGRDPSRVQVFEYYSDAILFKSLAPTSLATLAADATAYSTRAANIQDLMVGDRPWVGPPWHAWWFARCAWDPAADASAELARFCAAAFPGNALEMVRYYRSLEDAYRIFLDLHQLQPIPRHDVLDFSDTPRESLALKAREAVEAADRLASAAAGLATISGRTTVEAGRLDRERAQATAAAAAAGHLAHRAAAWHAALAGDRRSVATHLARAEHDLDTLEAWDARWNAPAYSVITAGMRRGMHHHINEIRRL